ncbi:hypothetical protein DFS34DRAFT_454479 [Phlyctochytrium arcticum]|nr:hypothetical protein DFS34DRAFT_454479 [Phlyctochytrium arcticum]
MSFAHLARLSLKRAARPAVLTKASPCRLASTSAAKTVSPRPVARKVGLPAFERSELSDPTPTNNPSADPLIVLKNAIKLKRWSPARWAFETCQQAGTLGKLTEEEGQSYLSLYMRNDGLWGPNAVKSLLEAQQQLREAGVMQPTDIESEAILVKFIAIRSSAKSATEQAAKWLEGEHSAEARRKMFDVLLEVHSGSGNLEAVTEHVEKMKSQGMELHADNFVALMQAYQKANSVDDVVKVFNEMIAAGVAPTEKSIMTVLSANAEAGRVSAAVSYFNELEKHGFPQGSWAWAHLIKASAVKNDYGQAERLYQEMRTKGVEANTYVYTTLIKMFGQAGNIARAVHYFYKKELVRGFNVRESDQMRAALIQAYVAVNQVDLAWRVLSEAVKGMKNKNSRVRRILVAPLANDVANKDPAYLASLFTTADIPPRARISILSRILDTLVAKGKLDAASKIYNTTISTPEVFGLPANAVISQTRFAKLADHVA